MKEREPDLFRYADHNWPPSPEQFDANDPDWGTTTQIAYAFRVSDRTVRRWVREKDISVKAQGRIWISRRRLLTL